MASNLMDLIVLIGILAIVVIAIWFIMSQMTLPEPFNRIVIVILVVLAAVVGIWILLQIGGGRKLVRVEGAPPLQTALEMSVRPAPAPNLVRMSS